MQKRRMLKSSTKKNSQQFIIMYEYHSLHVLSTTVDLRLSAVSLPPPPRYMEGLGVGGGGILGFWIYPREQETSNQALIQIFYI